jgi:hypothetical protein
MEPEADPGMGSGSGFCPECGAEERGFFCRQCGTLLHGEEMVLCPRCHHVVPKGEFCNQCGQGLGSIAISLRQLALAGDEFWVTGAPPVPAAAAPGQAEVSSRQPNDSVVLADGELPDWLQELPAKSAPAEVQAHIYPSLQPIEQEGQPVARGRFLTAVILLLGLMLLSLVVLVAYLLLGGGG